MMASAMISWYLRPTRVMRQASSLLIPGTNNVDNVGEVVPLGVGSSGLTQYVGSTGPAAGGGPATGGRVEKGYCSPAAPYIFWQSTIFSNGGGAMGKLLKSGGSSLAPP